MISPSLWATRPILDAPERATGRSRRMQLRAFFQVGMERECGERHYQRAIELYPHAWLLLLEYADKLRERGQMCEPAALKYYRMVLVPLRRNSRGRALSRRSPA